MSHDQIIDNVDHLVVRRDDHGIQSLVCRDQLILYRLETFRYYPKHRVLANCADGGDPPDYLYFIPIDEIIENPILTYNDPRLAYKGRYFIDAETEWTCETCYTKSFAVFITRGGLSVYRLPDGRHYLLPVEMHSFYVDKVDGDTIHIKYLRDDQDDQDDQDFDYDDFDDELDESKWERPYVSVIVVDLQQVATSS
jgi:hypothetical protein